MRINHAANPSSGFTLIELIISTALVSIILSASYLCFAAGIEGRKLVQIRSDATQSARVALAMIAADLRSATPLSEDFDFLGKDRELDGAPSDNLDFATHHYNPKYPREADWCEVSYFVGTNDETGTLSLFRRRDSSPDPEPLRGGRREEIATGVKAVNFEYYDGFDWWDDWGDKTANADAPNAGAGDDFLESNMFGMPEAVRVTISIDPDPKPESALARKSGAAEDSEPKGEPPVVLSTVVRLNLASLRWGGQAANGGDSSNANADPNSRGGSN